VVEENILPQVRLQADRIVEAEGVNAPTAVDYQRRKS
jgi:hypothetical protein